MIPNTVRLTLTLDIQGLSEEEYHAIYNQLMEKRRRLSINQLRGILNHPLQKVELREWQQEAPGVMGRSPQANHEMSFTCKFYK